VLGRYCYDPARYTLSVAGEAGEWRQVVVGAFLIERGGAGPSLPLRLDWTGTTYAWTGPPTLAQGC
jgi:hypothetical protein